MNEDIIETAILSSLSSVNAVTPKLTTHKVVRHNY